MTRRDSVALSLSSSVVQ